MINKNATDAAYCSVSSNFTQIPNEFLRNPSIPPVAKCVLFLLLSNKEGWKSYSSVIQDTLGVGKHSVAKAIKVLEMEGYVLRLNFVDACSKRFSTAIWAYTDIAFTFSFAHKVREMEALGLEFRENSIPVVDGKGYTLIGYEPKSHDNSTPKEPTVAPTVAPTVVPAAVGKPKAPAGKTPTHPTVEEVAEYCKERKNKVNASKFVNYYESNGWKVGKNKMVSWKAAVRTWESSSFKSEQTVYKSEEQQYDEF